MNASTTFRFVCDERDFSVYTRPDGSEVYLAHGFPRVYLVQYSDDWMRRQWEALRHRLSGHQFLDWLREHLSDPDVVDEVKLCDRCEYPTHLDDGSTVEGGDGFACDDCIDEHYYGCSQCGGYYRDTTTTLDDDEICEPCRNRYYTWCDHCDGYRADSDDNHDHDDDKCDCESPALRFHVRNDGEALLANDEMVTVRLPPGTVDEEGITRISIYLATESLLDASRIVCDLDRRWQTKEGNYTKRLSRALYKKHGTKIEPAVLARVGSIARDHSTSVDFCVATTRDLNMGACDFYHSDSCWWEDYYESRCALKSNGGFGLRSFNGPYGVTGRAWVMPLKMDDHESLVPTFNTETPDAFVVFNTYGQLGGYAAARIVAHMAGMTYRKVTFTCSPMYVNGATGYLVAPEDIAGDYTDGSLHLSTDAHCALYHTETKELVHV